MKFKPINKKTALILGAVLAGIILLNRRNRRGASDSTQAMKDAVATMEVADLEKVPTGDTDRLIVVPTAALEKSPAINVVTGETETDPAATVKIILDRPMPEAAGHS